MNQPEDPVGGIRSHLSVSAWNWLEMACRSMLAIRGPLETGDMVDYLKGMQGAPQELKAKPEELVRLLVEEVVRSMGCVSKWCLPERRPWAG